jgi:hypothetical protein
MLSFSVYAQKEDNYGFDEGCLTTVDIGTGIALGRNSDQDMSLYISHIKDFTDNLYLGLGVGINQRQKYKTTLLPLYFDIRYYMLDKRFSPFIALKLGTFVYLSAKNTDNKQSYSIEKNNSKGFHFFFSPSVGTKWRLSETFGLHLSLSDEQYLMRIYDSKYKKYTNRLVGNLAFSVGCYFQINGF